MIRQRMIAGAVAVVAIVGLSACGSDSKSSDTTAAKATTTTTGAKASATTEKASATTTDDAAGASTSVGDSIPEVTTGDATGECIQLQKDIEDVVGVDDLDNLDADKMGQAFDEIKKRVPSDLKDDVDTLSAALLPFIKAMQNAGTGAAALNDPDVVAAMAAVQDPKVTTAENNLNTWFNSGCPS